MLSGGGVMDEALGLARRLCVCGTRGRLVACPMAFPAQAPHSCMPAGLKLLPETFVVLIYSLLNHADPADVEAAQEVGVGVGPDMAQMAYRARHAWRLRKR